MKLTEHFTLEELTRSDTARVKRMNNTPSVADSANLLKLCQQILEPIREAYGHPIQITSGYRSPKVNAAVGGAKTSQHQKGEAADITCSATSKAQLFHLIKSLIERKKIYVGQLIWEYGSEHEPGWIHISLPRINKPNNQILYLYSK